MLPCARQAGGNQIKSEAWPLATGNADPEQPIPLAEPPPPPICAASSASWATRELLSSLRVAPPACHDNHLARIAGTNGMRTQPSSACMHRPRARSMPTHPTTMDAMSDWMVGGGATPGCSCGLRTRPAQTFHSLPHHAASRIPARECLHLRLLLMPGCMARGPRRHYPCAATGASATDGAGPARTNARAVAMTPVASLLIKAGRGAARPPKLPALGQGGLPRHLGLWQ